MSVAESRDCPLVPDLPRHLPLAWRLRAHRLRGSHGTARGLAASCAHHGIEFRVAFDSAVDLERAHHAPT